MDIAFDSASQSTYVSAVSSITFSHTTVAADYLSVQTGVFDGTSAADAVITGITYNGVALTKDFALGSFDRVELWRLVAPPIGTYNIVVSFTGTITNAGANSIALTGVSQKNPSTVTSGVGGSGTSSTRSVTPLRDNAWIINLIALQADKTSQTPGGSQTQRGSGVHGSNVSLYASTQGPITPPASTASTWSWTGSTGFLTASVVVNPLELKTIDGLAVASVKTVDGLAIASVKTFNGLS